MNFKININGSDPKSIRDQFIAVGDAAQALEKALNELRGDALHPRNYLTVESGELLRQLDLQEAASRIRECRAIFDWACMGVGQLVQQREGL